MYPKTARVLISLVLGIGLFLQAALPGAGVIPVQAASPVQLEWIQSYGPFTGGAAEAQYGNALAESADGKVYVVGAGSETVSGAVAQGAAYVFKLGSGWTNSVLHAEDGAAGAHFGNAVAISSDGNTVLVAAYQATVGGHTKQGAAYVFVWTGSAWIPQAKLMAPAGAAFDFFGASVALSSDGSTALIGVRGYTYSTLTGQGGAYVFTRTGTTWLPQTTPAPLIAYDAAANDGLGDSVALSGDGNTALVSAPNKSVNRGAAYVYVRAGTAWSFQRKFTAWNAAIGDDFGRSVSLSSDGSLALIGADNASPKGSLSGAAYTFTRSGSLWSNGQELMAPDGAAGDWFGDAVSLSGDGSTAVIGAVHASPHAYLQAGAAYVFYGSGFGLTQKMLPGREDANDYVGSAVALDGDGSRVIAGAPDLTGSITHQGGVYIFDRLSSTWMLQYTLGDPAGAPNDFLGDRLALSSDGSTAVIGSANMNKIFIYTRAYNKWSLQKAIPSDDSSSVNFGASVAISGNGNVVMVGAWKAEVGLTVHQGAAYLYIRSGTSWSGPLEFVADAGATGDNLGTAVALSQDGLTAAFGAAGESSGKGAVYVTTGSGDVWSPLARIHASVETATSYFGDSVALSADGGTLLVGAYDASNGSQKTGAAYAYLRSGGVYSEQKKFAPASGVDYVTRFGKFVALSSDGNTALIGAPSLGGGSYPGQAAIYVRSAGNWTLQTTLAAADNIAQDQFGSGVSLSANGNMAVIGALQTTALNGILFQGAAYVYSRSGVTWSLQAKLSSENGAAGDENACQTAISGDGHILLFNGNLMDLHRGGVFFFSNNPVYPLFVPVLKK